MSTGGVGPVGPPFRRAFDAARNPRDARNALGITNGGGGGGGGGAPTSAEYITSSADPTLTAERVLTNTATVTWDFSTAGQAKANITVPPSDGNVYGYKNGTWIALGTMAMQNANAVAITGGTITGVVFDGGTF